MSKDLHVTIGYTDENIFIKSNLFDQSKNDIIALDAPLHFGPLCNLGDTEGIQARKDWLAAHIGSIFVNQDADIEGENLIRLQTIVNRIADYDKLYLWLDHEKKDKLTVARILHHIQGANIPIYRAELDESNATVIQHIRKEGVVDTKWYSEEITMQEQQNLIRLWEQVVNDGHHLHLFDVNNKLIATDISFFDKFLLARCTEETQFIQQLYNAVELDVFRKIDYAISFERLVLEQRMSQLREEGFLEFIDLDDRMPLSQQKYYKVRTTSAKIKYSNSIY